MSVKGAGDFAFRQTHLAMECEAVSETEIADLLIGGFPNTTVAGGKRQVVEKMVLVEHDRFHLRPSVFVAFEKSEQLFSVFSGRTFR